MPPMGRSSSQALQLMFVPLQAAVGPACAAEPDAGGPVIDTFLLQR